MKREEILINLLEKKVEKNNFAINKNYESAAYCRYQEKKIESVFFYHIRDDENYYEFKYIEYDFIPFQKLLRKYLTENYIVDFTENKDRCLLYNDLLKSIQRDRKLKDLGI